jgi:hypothetical protein
MTSKEEEEGSQVLEYAKKVVVSLVSSPFYPRESQIRLDDELKKYFSKERVFEQNDFFHLKSIQDSSKPI